MGLSSARRKNVESPQKLINVNTVRHEKGLEIDAKSRRLILSEGISTIYLHISVQQALKRYLNGIFLLVQFTSYYLWGALSVTQDKVSVNVVLVFALKQTRYC